MLEKMLIGHWSGVAGAHFQLSCLHRIGQVCVQSAVPGSQPQQDALVSSVQLVVAVRFVVSWVFLAPFRMREGHNDGCFVSV